MDSLVYQIEKDEVWQEYLEFKKNQASISKQEISELEDYIQNKKYKKITAEIVKGEYEFSIPEKHFINKINKSKKRVVYSFNQDENMVLKLITFLFSKKYDHKYCDNCYSFRKKYTVKDAMKKLCISNNKHQFHGYKIDIENYFNSIDVNLLLAKLKKFVEEDNVLYEFLKDILVQNKSKLNNEIIEENRGIMAGVPISAFLANIFLQDLDEYFKNENVLYARYSDDIIFFTEQEKLENYLNILQKMVNDNKLKLNQNKIQVINPNDKWDFLGFSYKNGVIDISEIAKKKIKGKIKRACRKLRRWMIKNNADSNRAISAVIRKFNRKFYMIENKNELTWQLWYFPVINTTESLHDIDLYMQECLRYIKTGRFNAKNYNLKYEELKELGYRPLVGEYYKYKKNISTSKK